MRFLGIDYGTKRLGIALSDPLQIIAQGHGTILSGQRMFDEINKIVEEYQVVRIIVGLPLNLKGEHGQKATEVQDFINKLRDATNLDVISFDERFTSRIAHQTLREMNVKKKKREEKQTIDSMAAALILQGYLDMIRHRKNYS